MFDLLIKNARVLDGTGTPHYISDLAVKDGKIAKIAKNIKEEAKETIDAHGLTLTPGFIDAHSHFDLYIDAYQDGFNNLMQGITTSVAGMCGQSAAPVGKGFEHDLQRVCSVGGFDITSDYEKRGSFRAYIDDISKYDFGHNTAFHIGHGTLRAAVMGFDGSKPTPAQMDKMKAILRKCMEEGALGISFGLIYPPSSYASTAEMEELCAVVAEYGGDCTVHIRNDGDRLIESTEEMIGIAERTGCRLILSHQKGTFKQNWGKLVQVMRTINEKTAQGVDIFFDVYPYTASSTTLGRFIPQELYELPLEQMLDRFREPASRAELKERILAGRNPDEYLSDTMVGASVSHPEYVGKRLPEIAKEFGKKDACEALFDIYIDDKNTANGIYFRMCEEDVEAAISNPRGMIGTDGLYFPQAQGPHPRAFGTFPRYLGHYVRERKLVSLPEAIRIITSMPAAVYGLPGKGLLREGYDADMVLFDPDAIIDKADYVNPMVPGEGIKYVFVAGECAVCDNKLTGKLCGKPIVKMR